jgi:hypothetical protein
LVSSAVSSWAHTKVETKDKMREKRTFFMV